MARYALVRDGEVINVIVAEPKLIDTFDFGDCTPMLLSSNSQVGVDHVHDGKKFVKKPEPEPKPYEPTDKERLIALEKEIAILKSK